MNLRPASASQIPLQSSLKTFKVFKNRTLLHLIILKNSIKKANNSCRNKNIEV
jgi:hypothetical protein